MTFLKDHKRLSQIVGLAAIILLLPVFIRLVSGNQYGVLIACISLIYIIAVSGLDILFGYSGQMSMGHAAFFVLGCYASGMLNKYFALPLFVTIPMATIFTMIVGGILAYPASKLKFHFLTLATIAFSEVIYNVLYFSPNNLTGNAVGMYTARIEFLTDFTAWYYFLLFFTSIALLCKHFLFKSRVGRAFTAIRENTHAADGMGVNVRKHKILAFMTSSFYAGLAGALYVHLIGYIHPDTVKQRQSVLFLTMLLFGGTSSIVGPVIGVIVINILLEVVRPLQEYQMLLYGVLLLVVIIALPGGIYGGIKDIWAGLKRRQMAKRASGSGSAGDADV